MAGRIPEEFIETLLERVDIVELIGSRLPLKRAGREYKACCPFHDENTPSFYVSPQKQFYHCFGCGAHGTAIGFAMEYDGLEFPDAVEMLAAGAGLEVPRAPGVQTAPRLDGLLAATAAAQDWFRRQLEQNDPARDYLHRRGVDAEAIEAFGVGYAPDAWDGLMRYLAGQGISETDMERAGLVATRDDGRRYDRFRHRVMFPIHDRRGRVIAFGGRALGDHGPKYLNSPESPLFQKGRELYRLFQVRRGGRPARLLVVEGYMDALALHQFGMPHAVATLGTAVGQDQVELMFRTCPEVVFCFDGDEAGRRAAWRALEVTLPVLKAGREARFLFLPEGEDPDSLVRARGQAGLQALINEASPLSRFFFDALSSRLDTASLDGRARLVALAEPYMKRLPPGPFAELMAAELHRLSGYRTTVPDFGPAPQARPSPAAGARSTLVQEAITRLVQAPALGAAVDPQVLAVPGDIKGVVFLRELIDFCRAKPHLSTAVILEHWRDRAEGPHLARLAARPLTGDPDSWQEELEGLVTRIRAALVRSRHRALIAKQRDGRLSDQEFEEIRNLESLLAEQAAAEIDASRPGGG